MLFGDDHFGNVVFAHPIPQPAAQPGWYIACTNANQYVSESKETDGWGDESKSSDNWIEFTPDQRDTIDSCS